MLANQQDSPIFVMGYIYGGASLLRTILKRFGRAPRRLLNNLGFQR